MDVIRHQAVGVDGVPKLEPESLENVNALDPPFLIFEDRRSWRSTDGDGEDQAGIAVDGPVETDSMPPGRVACGAPLGRGRWRWLLRSARPGGGKPLPYFGLVS